MGTGAVFLSYSSEDADAARRIRDALQAAGIEVWFDKEELRGGDAWDASIRKRIKDCALFVPIISASTNARAEGYFRLEWKLAVDRSHLMAEDQPFLMPVVIDDTAEATARVPDRFRELHWSRPFGAETPTAFANRALALLAGRPAAAPASPSRAAPASESPSIAVLPFVNMSRDEENEYFADGLSEELLNLLAKIAGLRVASRTSAFWFKGKNVDIPAVAQKLNVATILEGSVRKSGKRVRITAQLIDAASDSHLWSETYDRELDDVFAVQDDIAQAVVTELRTALMGKGRSQASLEAKANVEAASGGRTASGEAHQLCLKGRFYMERMTEADLARATLLFKQATELDPKYAMAWVGLAQAYGIEAGYGWRPVESGYEESRAAATQALDVAPGLAEAYCALAHVLQSLDWDWPGATALYRKALELAPASVEAMRGYSTMLGYLGRKDEGLELLRRAVALDPLNSTSHRLLGLRCAIFGQLEEGERALATALELNPTAGLVHTFMAVIRLMQGNPQAALESARREVLPDFKLLGVSMAEHSLGHAEASNQAMDALIFSYGQTAAYQIAEAAAWRGEVDRAFEWLDKAYVQRDPGMAHASTDPHFKDLHGDPRWPLLMRKMGFASE